MRFGTYEEDIMEALVLNGFRVPVAVGCTKTVLKTE